MLNENSHYNLMRFIKPLERAYSLIQRVEIDTIHYDNYRSASVKEFEIILKQAK